MQPASQRLNRGVALKKKTSEVLAFYLFISPWLLGFLLLSLIPMLYSLVSSFMDWDGIVAPVFTGLKNFSEMFRDELFYKSLGNTFYFALASVPLNIIVALFLAMMINAKRRGAYFFRSLFYLPSVVSGVAIYVVWLRLFNSESGYINYFLKFLGIQGPSWLKNPKITMLSIILMSVSFCGSQMLIFLAGLQDVPRVYYEAALIDGAGRLTTFFRITLPLLSPVILFNLIMGIIGGLQVFTQPFVLSNGEGTPAYSTYVYAMGIYKSAFMQHRFGYASALAWVMFLVIMALSLLVFASSKKWVFQQGGDE